MTYSNRQKSKRFFAVFAFFSILLGNLSYAAKAKDLGQPDELSLGSSVFVFRGSSKKPQYASSAPKYFQRNIANRKSSKVALPNQKAVTDRHKKFPNQTD